MGNERLLLDSEWDVKPCRGRQNLEETNNELLLKLKLDSQDILAEDYDVSVFLERVDAVLREREYRKFNKGLN